MLSGNHLLAKIQNTGLAFCTPAISANPDIHQCQAIRRNAFNPSEPAKLSAPSKPISGRKLAVFGRDPEGQQPPNYRPRPRPQPPFLET